MGIKETAVVGATVIALAVGANQLLQPTTVDEIRQQHDQQQVDNLSDADQSSKDRIRENGDDQANAETDRRNRSALREPPDPHRPHIRLRLR